MQTWNYPDRHPPGDGPWSNEPDKVQWVDPETDLDCLMVRAPLGHWCGYVGVPPGHPWYDVDYGRINVEVHGGLTYSDRCMEGQPEPAVCHVPLPGRPAEVFWIGFDCAHVNDLSPSFAARTPEYLKLTERDVYRDLAYVTAEVLLLASQVHAARTIPMGFCCPRCDMVSYNQNDLREGYCGNCHDWTATS